MNKKLLILNITPFSDETIAMVEEFRKFLENHNFDVTIDERDIRPSIKFQESEDSDFYAVIAISLRSILNEDFNVKFMETGTFINGLKATDLLEMIKYE